ncbi:hypothetical protein BDA96_05G237600 [Sorghum bicolor]|uniref:Uncharacterized protein n=2 Tax=Sorghum bicolor TaxID=4558 RepID=A0A921UGN5_SORBI|nr:hypothetical protein BDA96_05G237600 [Sorghum bicolor]KXG29167.1 hypothetical protein SORBI_3005G221800 [Sorghum bicolor]
MAERQSDNLDISLQLKRATCYRLRVSSDCLSVSLPATPFLSRSARPAPPRQPPPRSSASATQASARPAPPRYHPPDARQSNRRRAAPRRTPSSSVTRSNAPERRLASASASARASAGSQAGFRAAAAAAASS